VDRSEPVLTTIIVTHNSSPSIIGCLSHLRESTVEIPHEIIVVDNNSTDNTPSIVRQKYPEAKVVTNHSNSGFADACNQGAALSSGRYLLFLNPDAFVDSDSITELIRVSDGSNNTGLVSGRLRYPDGRFQASCRNFPTISNLLFSRGSIISRFSWKSDISKKHTYTLSDYKEVTIVPAVAAAMVLVRRSIFEKIGGFDTRFFMFMEDTDLSIRLHESGYVNLFVPGAGAVHDWGKGSSVGKIRRTWWHHVSMWKYVKKHFEPSLFLSIVAILLVINFVVTSILPGHHGRNMSD